MKDKVTIFDIELDRLTAKRAMKQMMKYLEGETISTVELIPMGALMKEKENPMWKSMIEAMDLVLPADREILESADITDDNAIRDLEKQTFLGLLFRYLERNHKTAFLLSEREEDLVLLRKRVSSYRKEIHIVGEAAISADDDKKDSVINAINGVEPDCIISALESPWQEQFITESKALLNARVWLGCGAMLAQPETEKKVRDKFQYFIMKKIFRYQVEKGQKE